MHRILITSRVFKQTDDETFGYLRENGCEIVPNPCFGRIMKEDELIQNLPGIHGVILGVEILNEKVFSHADSLKTISRFGVGYDNIDIPSATKKGISVSYVPGANVEAVADLTIGLLISICRKIGAGWDLIRSGGWQGLQGPEVWGKTLGVIGLGRIGKAVIRRAKGFNMKIIGYDEYPNPAYCKEHDIELVDNIEAILKNSDFITLHIPCTDSSRNLISSKELGMMKPTAYIINAARGGIIDEEALYTCLKEKKIAGAALDVLAVEPMQKGNKLAELDNIIITPHIAGNSYEAIQKTKQISVENLLAGLNGKTNENFLNMKK